MGWWRGIKKRPHRWVPVCAGVSSIRDGHGGIMAGRFGVGGVFYGSLQSIHLIHFRGCAAVGGGRAGVSSRGGNVAVRGVQVVAVQGDMPLQGCRRCGYAVFGVWCPVVPVRCAGGFARVGGIKKHPRRLVSTGVFHD